MDLDWSKIRNGPKFNALVSALLYQQDHRTHVFNREGKDGAIDALSGDRKTVYQSKYHRPGTSSSTAFADVKKELEKIEKYRQPGHTRYPMWKDVTSWCLVTNVPMGSQDDLRWQKKVVPAFEALGITSATFKSEAHLQIELVSHREIAEAFFGDRPRVFVSLHEHLEAILSQEVLPRAYDVPLQGRDSALSVVRDFVEKSPHNVLLIEGPGGVGKTRLQYEAAVKLLDEEVIETVYCGTPHLAESENWYLGIVPDVRGVVIIDDPKDPAFVERFLYEMRTRAKEWKAIITVRSQKDPVIAVLRNPRERLLAEPIVLTPLDVDPAAAVASRLLAPIAIPNDNRARAAKWVASVCGRFPIWMTVAARLLEARPDLRDLPEDDFQIAREYVAEIKRHTKPELATPAQVLSLLRWIALAQPINQEAHGVFAYLASASGMAAEEDVKRLIADLGRRRVLTFYGAQSRMIEIRPDVLRDHLLIDWLTYEDNAGLRQPTSDARGVAGRLASEALDERPSPFISQIVRSLARLELTVEPKPPFLDPLADAAVQLAEQAVDTIAQHRALKVAALVSWLRPASLARVAELIRVRDLPVGTERTVFGDFATPRERVIDDLPWELFNAAHGAGSKEERKAILRELLELIDMQAKSQTRRGNTGRSAVELLPRVLHERHGYRSSFHNEAATAAADALSRIERGEVPRESWRTLVLALISLERHDSYISPDDSNKFTWETFGISPEASQGKIAAAIRERLWAIVANPGPQTPAKNFAWPILDTVHSSLNRSDKVPAWHALVVDDLKRCLEIALNPATALEELQAARALWDWHVQHDEDPAVRPIAVSCEAAYLKHPVVSRYAKVFGTNRVDAEAVIDAEADAWPVDATAAMLEQYLRDAFLFARTHAERWRDSYVNSFVWRIGERHGRDAGVRDFIATHIAIGSSGEWFATALRLASASLFEIRKQGDDAAVAACLAWLDSLVPDEASRIVLLATLYAGASRPIAQRWTTADAAFMDQCGSRPIAITETGPWRSPKPAHGDHRNRAWRSPKPVRPIAEIGRTDRLNGGVSPRADPR